MTHPRVQDAVRTIRGEAGKIVQSMYFEGNPATWAHQDSYYLDAEVLGRMVGAWIAVEDIAPGAGRFFIYPGSHRLDVARNGGKVDIAFNHGRYKQLVTDCIRTRGMQCRTDRKSTRLNSVTNAHLVCRILLEKKKQNRITNNT